MRLSVQIEFDKTMDFETPKKNVVVGRSPHSDLVVPHESVSRQHCRIEEIEGSFFITDLGSSNGTFIDGERLKTNLKTSFKSSSQLKLGKVEAGLVKSQAASEIPQDKIISSQVSGKGNYTATVRVGRIELDRPSITLELEKKSKTAIIRNPISEHFKSEPDENTSKKKSFLIIGAILVIAIAWILGGD